MTRTTGLLLFTAVILTILLWCGGARAAEESKQKLRVGVSPFEPFVIMGDETVRGFSVDLWSAVTRELGVEYTFVRAPGVKEKLADLRDGNCDVAIGGITITSQREESLDFSHPYFHTGLDIMVRDERGLSIWDSVKSMMTRTKLTIIIAFVLLIVGAGHLMWWAERGKEAFSDHYIPGVLEGMYWAIVTASTVGYGDKAPAKWTGRILAGLVIIIALPLFCVFTAELASSFTMQKLRSEIRGPEDLLGRRVAVINGTTSDAYVSRISCERCPFDTVDRAAEALIRGEVDAVVYDAPNLHYYVRTRGQGRVAIVGKPFMPQHFGMAVRAGDPLRERLNRVLLTLDESGELQEIHKKWFGSQGE